jgi:hydroxyacylglutathione hydrolase
MKIHCLPAFNDNYLWLFHEENSSQAYIVDPGDADVVEKALLELNLELAGIFLTHHHFDHTGGVEALLKNRKIDVYAGIDSQIKFATQHLNDNEDFTPTPTLKCKAIAVPGHTLDHIAYYFAEQQILFAGDTLFAAGCGRVFEGTHAQMHNSLQKLASLPPATKVYCAHEYTLANLNFALAVEPNNLALQNRMKHSQKRRKDGFPTVPFCISDETATNPFLRTSNQDVIDCAQARSDLPLQTDSDVFAEIRSWKDVF